MKHVKDEFDAEFRWNLQMKEAQERESGKKGDDPEPAMKVTKGLTANVQQALASLANLPGEVEPPAWIVSPHPWPVDEVLAAPNALIHLPSLVEARPNAILDPTPTFFITGVIGSEWRADAPPPLTWLSFLRELWPDDAAAIETLQEFFGYCLTSDTSQQKILFVLGPRRSGKGTIIRVLRALVGDSNTTAPTLSSLSLPFGLAPLLGKTLATISDARLSKRTDLAQITERLLSISGEDGQTIERKHLPAVTVPRLPIRFVILSNELPALHDSSGALVGRLLILQQTKSWFGREDRTLSRRLLDELPGVLSWAIEGWRRLRERGRFHQPESAPGSWRRWKSLLPRSAPLSANCAKRERGARSPFKTCTRSTTDGPRATA